MFRRLVQKIMYAGTKAKANAKAKAKVVVIAGTTGVGKSQLSIEIAKRYNGEIINSDSMQVYKGLPIITNKHPIEEREGIPHHVINFVPWNEEYYLHRFEKDALHAIDDIISRGKLPIIVGGTHYYLQFLFNKYVPEANMEGFKENDNDLTIEQTQILNSYDKDLIYNTLVEVDPEIASRYHPNDTRRVHRMLEIFYKTGIKPSETFVNQNKELRYDTLFFWIYSNVKPLEQRLDDRVDQMLETGGMEEIQDLFKYYNEKNFTLDQCKNGIWQVIGFKEFLPWLLNKSETSLDECVDRMKLRTRQYAKRQVKWIQKMLIPDINGDIYLLNASDISKWHNLVGDRATGIAENFIKNQTITQERTPTELAYLLTKEQTVGKKLENDNDFKHHTCNICKNPDGEKLIAIGAKNWTIHLKSRRHKSNLTRGTKKAAYEKWKKDNEEKGTNTR